MTMPKPDPAQRRTWLFGPGADPRAHEAMTASGASVLIDDLEDFTPPERRIEARELAPALFGQWRAAGALVCARINPLEDGGLDDLHAVLPAGAQLIAYPKASAPGQMRELDAQITKHERGLGLEPGSIEILPVCETALGVVAVRELATASARIRCALLGAEDLAADLCAERTREAIELEYARARFVLECRAAGIEPIDAPYTFDDAAGAAEEARRSRRLGYKTKSLVRPEHVKPVHEALVPTREELEEARKIVTAFEACRARGEDRVLVDGLWIEVPTYLNAKRLLAHP